MTPLREFGAGTETLSGVLKGLGTSVFVRVTKHESLTIADDADHAFADVENIFRVEDGAVHHAKGSANVLRMGKRERLAK